ncbi:hypothetical protein OQI89_05195 [Lentilactobacillus diolivorans]|mgnify:CR=1 FL=1|uniref:hypothetical protein n=1 Tax=Lentilactobacillus diolivorans TaxID=179838 RepID=UPI0024697411|nr:hypothetical protein [Lentilactobacillus diolivorans]MDH5105249.1 hypothetical protein [Lentilactobacillus diolivorans]
MTTITMNWKSAIKTSDDFEDYLTHYFEQHQELTGSYTDKTYFEYWNVRLNSHDGLIISMTLGNTPTTALASAPMPFKDTEKLTIEQFRQLVLHKKFSNINISLSDIFRKVAEQSVITK